MKKADRVARAILLVLALALGALVVRRQPLVWLLIPIAMAVLYVPFSKRFYPPAWLRYAMSGALVVTFLMLAESPS